MREKEDSYRRKKLLLLSTLLYRHFVATFEHVCSFSYARPLNFDGVDAVIQLNLLLVSNGSQLDQKKQNFHVPLLPHVPNNLLTSRQDFDYRLKGRNDKKVRVSQIKLERVFLFDCDTINNNYIIKFNVTFIYCSRFNKIELKKFLPCLKAISLSAILNIYH